MPFLRLQPCQASRVHPYWMRGDARRGMSDPENHTLRLLKKLRRDIAQVRRARRSDRGL